MNIPLVDTNIFIRYFTKDDPTKAQQAYTLFKRIENGELKAQTREAVVIEIVQVLESKKLYNLPRIEIRRHLHNVLYLRGLRLPKKKLILAALDLYAETNLDFVDCLLVNTVMKEDLAYIVSFDADFDKHNIKRKEPDNI